MFTVRLLDGIDILVGNGERGPVKELAWVRLQKSERRHGGVVGIYMAKGPMPGPPPHPAAIPERNLTGITVVEERGFAFDGNEGEYTLVAITEYAEHHVWACQARLYLEGNVKELEGGDLRAYYRMLLEWPTYKAATPGRAMLLFTEDLLKEVRVMKSRDVIEDAPAVVRVSVSRHMFEPVPETEPTKAVRRQGEKVRDQRIGKADEKSGRSLRRIVHENSRN